MTSLPVDLDIFHSLETITTCQADIDSSSNDNIVSPVLTVPKCPLTGTKYISSMLHG